MLKIHFWIFIFLLVLKELNCQVGNLGNGYGVYGSYNNVAENFQNMYLKEAVNQGTYAGSFQTESNGLNLQNNIATLIELNNNKQYGASLSNSFPFQPIGNYQSHQDNNPFIQSNLIPLISASTSISNDRSVYGQIIVDQTGLTQTRMYTPNCANYINGICESCSFRFIKAFDGVCEPVNPLCATWNSNGACLTCYPGYEICQNGCIMIESCAPQGTYDPNCQNTINGVCKQCSFGYYFNQNGICTQSNPFCRTSDYLGNCLSCYAGYRLIYGNCTVSIDLFLTNPFCTRWNNGVCQQCSNSSWYNGTNCIPFDPMCTLNNKNNGNCLGCYSGYILQGGKCYINKITQPTNLLCRRWGNNGICVQCSNNAYFNKNMCIAADPLCLASNWQNGVCLSCYSGYSLQNGRCVVIPPNLNHININKYCSVWNGTICSQCAQNSYFDNNRICIPVNPNCAGFGNFGQCLSCYNGYALLNNNCVINNSTVNVGNALCARWNDRTCEKCAARSINMNGVCTAVNTLCNTWDNFNGFCTSCYNGYILNGNNCIVNNQNINNNPFCRRWNGANCVQCATRTYFVGTVCTAVNVNCNTYDSQYGQCTSCYNGFILQRGICAQLNVQPTIQNRDIYCARSDSKGICFRCFYGFALQNGVCIEDFKNTTCRRNPSSCRS